MCVLNNVVRVGRRVKTEFRQTTTHRVYEVTLQLSLLLLLSLRPHVLIKPEYHKWNLISTTSDTLLQTDGINSVLRLS